MPASSRLPELGRRGQGWVAAQSVLFLAIAVATLSGVEWPGGVASTLVLGFVLLACGLLLLVTAGASLALARAATVLPRPRRGARLAQ